MEGPEISKSDSVSNGDVTEMSARIFLCGETSEVVAVKRAQLMGSFAVSIDQHAI